MIILSSQPFPEYLRKIGIHGLGSILSRLRQTGHKLVMGARQFQVNTAKNI